MSRTETETRAAILAEARRWIGTPFHHRQRCHGRGVDCVNLLVAVYAAVGLVPNIELPWYPHDWHLHRDGELLVNTLSRYAHPVGTGLPGDVAVYGFGRNVSHAAIIENGAHIIHAYLKADRVERTERDALAARLATEWSANQAGKPVIPSYWSVFGQPAAAAGRMAA